MTETKEEITLEKNLQEQEELKAEYEKDRNLWQAKKLELENLVGKKNTEILNLQHDNESLSKDRDSWKSKAHAANKVHQAEKKVQQQNDVLSELSKLQEKKGIKLDPQETNQ